jgi:hypothetical protein
MTAVFSASVREFDGDEDNPPERSGFAAAPFFLAAAINALGMLVVFALIRLFPHKFHAPHAARLAR